MIFARPLTPVPSPSRPLPQPVEGRPRPTPPRTNTVPSLELPPLPAGWVGVGEGDRGGEGLADFGTAGCMFTSYPIQEIPMSQDLPIFPPTTPSSSP